MSATVLISLPQDEARVDKLLDALVDERLDVQWFSTAPGDADWDKAALAASHARCVLICWSHATRSDAAIEYRELARSAAAADTAIGIELDKGAPPPDIPMTIYGLGGWRRAEKGVIRWAIGQIFYNDIVSAAKFKVAGRDPAPPSAPAKLLVRQLWVIAVGIGGLMGVLSLPGEIYNKMPWPRFNEERAWAALPVNSCKQLADFRKKYPDGRYAELARNIYENRSSGDDEWKDAKRSAPFYVGASDNAPRASEAVARSETRPLVAKAVAKVCNGFVEAAGSRLNAAVSSEESWQCTTIGAGYVCAVTGNAICSVSELTKSDEENCRITGR